MNELEELKIKFNGLHNLIVEREKHAREAMKIGPEAYEAVVEGLIIDGADACNSFGPCPGCSDE